MKGKIVAAQEDNVDRAKIQADVVALRDQIATVVDAASFNGLNLLKRSVGANDVSVLASLNRSSTQAVSASNITFSRGTLESATAGTAANIAADLGAATTVQTVAGLATADARITYTEGQMLAVELTNAAGQGVTLSYTVTAANVAAGQTVTNLADAAAAAYQTQLTAAGASGAFDTTGLTINNTAAAIEITSAGTAAAYTYQSADGGGLAALSLMDVTTGQGAAAALSAIEPLIQNAIDAAATFGSAQGRIQTQSEYVSKIMDGLSSGIGALVDADMEEASAKLQALQVQQQLGIQALSIANQAPQNILALFR
jgi:flagellin